MRAECRVVPRALAVVALVGVVAGCSGHGTASPPSAASVSGAVAVPSYTPPADAPRYCTDLAETTALPQVPSSLASLAAGDVGLQSSDLLARAAAELRRVSTDAQGSNAAGVGAAADSLVASLARAAQYPSGAEDLQAIGAQLQTLGQQVQAACGFPS